MPDTLYGYVSLAEAATTLAAFPLWTALSTAQKTEALTQAFERIEGLRFQGTKTVTTQATAWPRTNVYVMGTLVASNVVPDAIQRAQCLEALTVGATLGDSDASTRASLQAQGVTQWEVGDAKEVYGMTKSGLQSPAARECVKRYVTSQVYLRP